MSLDFFGKRVELSFKGKSSSHTYCGVCATFLFFCFIGWSMYYLGGDMVTKSQPSVVQAEVYQREPPRSLIGKETINFGFALEHPDTFAYYIRPDIYQVTALQLTLTRGVDEDGAPTMSFDAKPISVSPCSTQQFGPVAEQFENFDLDNIYCFDEEQEFLEEPLGVQGRFENDYYQWIQVNFYTCDNATSTVPCADQDEIDSLLDGGYFSTIFMDLAVDATQYESPAEQFQKNFFTTFSQNYYKEYELFLRQIDFKSDNGWFLEDIQEMEYLSVDSVREQLDLRQKANFFAFQLSLTNIKSTYQRHYIKIQDVLAEIDGFITLGVVILYLVVRNFIEQRFYEELINDVFDVRIYRDEDDLDGHQDAPTKIKKKRTSRNSEAISTALKSAQIQKANYDFKKEKAKLHVDIPKKDPIEGKKVVEANSGNLPVLGDEFSASQADQKPKYLSPNKGQNKKNSDILQSIDNDYRSPQKERTKSGVTQETEIGVGMNFLTSQKKKKKIKFNKLNIDKEIDDVPEMENSGMNSGRNSVPSKNELPSPGMKEEKDSIKLTELNSPLRSPLRHYSRKRSPKKKTTILGNYGDMNDSDFIQSYILDNAQEKPGSQKVLNTLRSMKRESPKISDQRPSKHKLTATAGKDRIDIDSPMAVKISVQELPDENGNQVLEDVPQNEQDQHFEYPQSLNFLDEDDNDDKNTKESQGQEIRISVFEYLRSYFTTDQRVKKRSQLLKQGESRIRERLDIFNLLKKLRDIDKLKALLLDEQQLILFDNLPKPVLEEESQNVIRKASAKHAALARHEFIQQAKKQLIKIAYKDVLNRPEKTDIDEKLVDIYASMNS